jgi:hypothetical protein
MVRFSEENSILGVKTGAEDMPPRNQSPPHISERIAILMRGVEFVFLRNVGRISNNSKGYCASEGFHISDYEDYYPVGCKITFPSL